MGVVVTSTLAPLADVVDVVQLVSTAGAAAQVPTDDYPLIASMIARSGRAAITIIGRACLTTATITETQNGNGRSCIQLSEGPVQSITSVSVNGLTCTPRVSVPGPGYVNDDRFLYLFGGGTGPSAVGFQYPFGPGFAAGVQNVVVTYVAGYKISPMDVNDVIVEVVAAKYKNRGNLGQTSKDLAGEHVSFTPRDFTKVQIATLQRYSYWLSVLA